MKKSKEQVLTLPNWFSLEKYALASDFQLNDWLNAFQLRYYLFLLKDAWDEDKLKDPSIDEMPAALYEDFKHIQDSGANAHKALWYRDYTKDFSSSVTSIDVWEVFTIAENIGSETGGGKSIYKELYDQHEASLIEREGELIDSPLELMECAHNAMEPNSFPLHQIAFAKIDLSAPETTILSNFEKWLRQVRASHKHVKEVRQRKFSKKDTFNWFQSGVLPYLDIVFWAEREGVEISNRVIENAIFPIDRQINVAEVLKVTTIPLAEKVWSGDIVNSLEADLSGRAEQGVN
ncbi:MAG: hypothetical protein JWQ21_1448 [Herminiimonas sp.]|nr:hypothetical protein [Herminiimonas sp.]